MRHQSARWSWGSIRQKTCWQQEEALNFARAAASSAENEEKDQKQTLIRMLGWRYDADPVIQKVPEPDLARIASYDPAADISKAIENNVTLYDTRMASSSSQGGAVAKARTIKDQENEVRTSLDLLYKDVLQKQAAYEAAKTKFAADGADQGCGRPEKRPGYDEPPGISDGGKRLSGGGGGIYGSQPGFNGSHGGIRMGRKRHDGAGLGSPEPGPGPGSHVAGGTRKGMIE